ncbi:MAG: ATP-binding protein, partial [Planctomycetota bacterium]
MGFFEDKIVKDFQSLFANVDRVLLAVSGGADSVAMAHVLHRLTQEDGLSCGFVIGHVNHCLRGAESDADEAFVAQLGQ